MTDDGGDALLKHLALTPLLHDPMARIGVAVSGGSDSMAALYLMANAAPGQVLAVTVDHRLRSASADEARQVTVICAKLGVPHEIVEWDHGIITGNLQDQARRARYRLIAGWARTKRLNMVVLGHTADDQAETFLMGLAREAGLDGLTGMRREWTEAGVRFVRPFLCASRIDLRNWLRRQGGTWIDDPSNDNTDFVRVKARRVLKALSPLGITVDMLAGSAAHLAMVRAALDQTLRGVFDTFGMESAGAIAFPRTEFLNLPDEFARRLLARTLRRVASAEYGPRGAALGRMQLAISEQRDATLHGCRMRIRKDMIWITREPRALVGLVCPTDHLWDGRWQMNGPHAPDLQVRALGAEGLRHCKDWRAAGFSRDVLIVTPAIWQDDALVAAPLAGQSDGWTATVAAGFGLFAVSH